MCVCVRAGLLTFHSGCCLGTGSYFFRIKWGSGAQAYKEMGVIVPALMSVMVGVPLVHDAQWVLSAI